MSNKNEDRQGPGKFNETAFYAVLPLLCLAAVFRSCSVKSAQISDPVQQTAVVQEYTPEETEQTRSTPGDDETETAPEAAKTHFSQPHRFPPLIEIVYHKRGFLYI